MKRVQWTAAWATLVALLVAVSSSIVASANVALTPISSDPYTNTTSQHATEVEPDSFAYGSTIVMATQVGRFYDGGSSNIGFSTSTDSGATWTKGYLPGTTTFATPAGPYNRISDPSVAYDGKHNVWLISSLAITTSGSSVLGAAVIVNRSTDGGLTWSNPVVVKAATGLANLDKNWTVCDNSSTSPYLGNCYTEWDDNGAGNRIQMSTSSDGGATWGAAKSTGNNATGLGGQPVVQPNGTVIVPIANANTTAILAFRSTNGGASWSNTTTVARISDHGVAGNLRTEPLPSAEIDGSGKVYVVWQDCRFRSGCSANDIVMSTSTNGTSWSSVRRIPIDGTTSGVDHFIPGIAVDKATSGSTARLALTYYYYPTANCSASTCQLSVGYISSSNGGTSWSGATQITGPMSLSWLPSTSQGVMVGDYISTSFVSGSARPVFAVATAPSGSTFKQAINTTAAGQTAKSAEMAATTTGEDVVVATASDHDVSSVPHTIR